ncbi:interleukin-21 [Engraulis encrasicolus]|uniref:interleukin-21 n=1 Tax=Engraulis encrasicolus TaxID=184585 RepID=UPI002FD44741
MCSALVHAASLRDLKMRELLKDVSKLERDVKHNGSLSFKTPTEIKPCCMLSALECYHSQLSLLDDQDNVSWRRVNRSMGSPLIREKLRGSQEACGSSLQCQECHSYPNATSQVFMRSLVDLLQMV